MPKLATDTPARNRQSTRAGLVTAVAGSLVLLVAILFTLELWWSALGYRPSVNDSPSLWASFRATASREPNAAVIVGTSRVRAGLDPVILEEQLPAYRWIQLGLDGTSPLPVLEDLAADDNFRGLVIFEVFPPLIATMDPSAPRRAREFVAAYHHSTWGDLLESDLSVWLQSRLSLARQGANLVDLFRTALHSGTLRDKSYSFVRSDRYVFLDFARADIATVRDTLSNAAARFVPAEPAGNFETILRAADRIRRRGGQVVFVKMPVSGDRGAREDSLFPRSRTWDPLVAGQLNIHFADYPELSRFNCPEGSHLDYRDAALFSQSFGGILERLLESQNRRQLAGR